MPQGNTSAALAKYIAKRQQPLMQRAFRFAPSRSRMNACIPFRICIAVFLLFLSAPAQILTIRDHVSGYPLERALVASIHGHTATTTDAEGRADLTAFDHSDTIRVELIGYHPARLAYLQLERLRFALYLERMPLHIGDVVVSATRWLLRERDIPHRSVQIRAEQIQLINPQTAADLVAFSSEVSVQKSQLAGGSPMLRGFATNRVLIAVDGIRMNTAIFRTGNVQNIISLDPLTTERTEVLFGPGAVMYGSDAIGGVMCFQTLVPRLSHDARPLFSGHAVVRTSSANREKTGHLDLYRGWQKWGWVSSATWSDYGDLTMGSHGPAAFLRTRYVQRIDGLDSLITNPDPKKQVPSGYSQLNLLQKIRWRPGDAWDATYAFHYSATSDYPRYDRLLRPRGKLLRSAQWYYGPQIWMQQALVVANRRGNALWDEAKLILAYQYFRESRNDRDYRSPLLLHRTERVDAFSANIDLIKALLPVHSISGGAELLYNRIGSTGENENIITAIRTPGPSRYPDGASWSALALYAHYRWIPDSTFTVQAGLRCSLVGLDARFDTTFYKFPFTSTSMLNAAVNGSLGGVYSPASALQIKVALSTGFRAPNIDDVGKVFDSSPGYVVVPNPALKPEYAWNAELGATLTCSEAIKLDATAFYTVLQDAMVRRNFTLNGRDSVMYDGEMSRIQAIQNAAEANVRGMQASVEVQLPAGFGLNAHLTIMRGTEEMDDGNLGTLRHAPPPFGALHLTCKRHRLEMDGYMDYSDGVNAADLAPGLEGMDYLFARDARGRPYVPSWYTFNLKVRLMISHVFSIMTGVENITDQRYRTYASGITASGRNYTVAISAAF